MAEGTVRGDMAADATAPRLRGEAAWKAQRAAMDQKNEAAKKRAFERRQSADAVSRAGRDQRLGLQEAVQLRALNDRLGSRAPGGD